MNAVSPSAPSTRIGVCPPSSPAGIVVVRLREEAEATWALRAADGDGGRTRVDREVLAEHRHAPALDCPERMHRGDPGGVQ